MHKRELFFNPITQDYSFEREYITLGSALLNNKTLTKAYVNVPLKTMTRHGLIAGATGTGKTKTIQVLAENLSEKGKPTPLTATMMRAPMSRMGGLTDTELQSLLDNSKLVLKYNKTIDRESAYEMLHDKIIKAKEDPLEEQASRKTSTRKNTRQNPIIKVLTSATFIRAIFGILKKSNQVNIT